jgi:Protein of unknown function (DUF2752)
MRHSIFQSLAPEATRGEHDAHATEVNHEALWLGVSLAAAVVGVAWLRLGLPRPACPLHAATGLPCPGCGTTRAIEALLAGEWSAALALNPLACAALAGVVLFDLYAGIVLLGRLPRWRPRSPLPAPVRGGVIAAVALNWFWLMWREWR